MPPRRRRRATTAARASHARRPPRPFGPPTPRPRLAANGRRGGDLERAVGRRAEWTGPDAAGLKYGGGAPAESSSERTCRFGQGCRPCLQPLVGGRRPAHGVRRRRAAPVSGWRAAAAVLKRRRRGRRVSVGARRKSWLGRFFGRGGRGGRAARSPGAPPTLGARPQTTRRTWPEGSETRKRCAQAPLPSASSVAIDRGGTQGQRGCCGAELMCAAARPHGLGSGPCRQVRRRAPLPRSSTGRTPNKPRPPAGTGLPTHGGSARHWLAPICGRSSRHGAGGEPRADSPETGTAQAVRATTGAPPCWRIHRCS